MLGIPAQQIGRWDHFFDRGGTSLSAVKLVILLDRAVSLKDVTRHPVLAELAALVDGRPERRAGLLQPLSGPEARGRGAGVLPLRRRQRGELPAAGAALRGSGLAVYAVELPGHDLAAEREPFAPMAQVVEQVAAEITRLAPTRVLLWGHSSGTALAVETARGLQDAAWTSSGCSSARSCSATPPPAAPPSVDLRRRSDAEIAAR